MNRNITWKNCSHKKEKQAITWAYNSVHKSLQVEILLKILQNEAQMFSDNTQRDLQKTELYDQMKLTYYLRITPWAFEKEA